MSYQLLHDLAREGRIDEALAIVAHPAFDLYDALLGDQPLLFSLTDEADFALYSALIFRANQHGILKQVLSLVDPVSRRTILQHATAKGRTKIMQLLVKQNAGFPVYEIVEEHPFQLLIDYEHFDTLKAIKNTISVTSFTSFGSEPPEEVQLLDNFVANSLIKHCTSSENLSQLKSLLQLHSRPNDISDQLLDEAMKVPGNLNVLRFFVEEEKFSVLRRHIYAAINNDDYEMLLLLLPYISKEHIEEETEAPRFSTSDVSFSPNKAESSPLYLACKCSRLDMVELLLQHEAVPNAYAIYGAAENESLVAVLINHLSTIKKMDCQNTRVSNAFCLSVWTTLSFANASLLS